jgi:hypothetical protein
VAVDIALFKGVKYSGVRSTPLYFTLPYFTQLKNAITLPEAFPGRPGNEGSLFLNLKDRGFNKPKNSEVTTETQRNCSVFSVPLW